MPTPLFGRIALRIRRRINPIAAPIEGLQPFDDLGEDDDATPPASAHLSTAADADPFTAAAVTEVGVAEQEPEPAAPPVAAPTAAPAAAAQPSSAYADVAVRLEAIARALRESPDQLLSGAGSDPLGMLVTAYVLGYTHGRGNR